MVGIRDAESLKALIMQRIQNISGSPADRSVDNKSSELQVLQSIHKELAALREELSKKQ
ncbi:MAG: hypothetical protein PHF32_02170 [Candidatus Cloacimonetes bacterium]|nr:hypothetical protein [Candidatus Cloacimonadota bacterium]